MHSPCEEAGEVLWGLPALLSLGDMLSLRAGQSRQQGSAGWDAGPSSALGRAV